ncbi:hypothetical protein AVEN_268012-1, partial [Araneus ventricosus]
MKRASSESGSSKTAPKKLSTFNNTGGFTVDSIPPHHYHLGENNYAVASDFANVLNVYIQKFKTNENGRIFPTKNGSFLINFELSLMNSLYFDFCHSTVFPDFFFIMKRASSESASSKTAPKKLSTFNNTAGFTVDSIPPPHYHLGENNYAVVSDFANVLNVHIRKFK